MSFIPSFNWELGSFIIEEWLHEFSCQTRSHCPVNAPVLCNQVA
jgi:hypothetical protein